MVRNGKSSTSRPKTKKNDKILLAQDKAARQRDLDAQHLTPQQLAWLPYDSKTIDLINSWKDVKKLKLAKKFVVAIPGQERLRKLIDERLNELASVGEWR